MEKENACLDAVKAWWALEDYLSHEKKINRSRYDDLDFELRNKMSIARGCLEKDNDKEG